MAQRFTARAVVVGNRAGTVVPDAVLDVDDGRISWVGPAALAWLLLFKGLAYALSLGSFRGAAHHAVEQK